MSKLFFSLILPIALSLTACSTVLNNLPGVYTLEIQQGNMVDQEMIDQLKPGMTKRQVLYIMGSPMLVDFFHQKRWDYLYSRQAEGEDREQKRVALFFEGDILTGIQGDFKPDLLAAKPVKEVTVDVPPRDLEKTLWEKVVWLFTDEPEQKVKPAIVKKARVISTPAAKQKAQNKALKDTVDAKNPAQETDAQTDNPNDNNLLNSKF